MYSFGKTSLEVPPQNLREFKSYTLILIPGVTSIGIQKTYQNFPIVLAWKLKDNGKGHLGDSRKWKFLFPQNFCNKKRGEISSLFAVEDDEGVPFCF